MITNPKNILGFDDRLLALFCMIINTHSVMAIYYTGAFFEVEFKWYALKWFGEFFAVALLWIVIRWLYLQLLKRKSGLKNIKFRLLIIPTFLIPYFLISVWFILFIQPNFEWPYPNFTDPITSVQITTGAIIFFIDMGLYEALHLFVELKDAKIQEERLKKENVSNQLHNLKHQISPHFLFNSLNTLVYLIDTDKETSKEFVYLLSRVYKRVLEYSNTDLITLKDELNHVKDYVGLLEKRFGNNLNVEFRITNDITEKRVVPLCIQAAIENAIKHNIISRKNPLHISVYSANEYLIIKNNLQIKMKSNAEGMGLRTIKNHYKLLTSKEIIISKTPECFELKLPLIASKTLV